MPIKLEIVADTYAEFAQHLAGVLMVLNRLPAAATRPVSTAQPEDADVKGPGEATPEPEAEPAKTEPAETPRRRGRKPRAAKQVDIEEAIEERAQAEGSEDHEAAEAAQSVSLAEVKDSLLALMGAKGDDAPVECLNQFGVSKISALKPEQYAEVIERAKKMAAAK